MSLIINSIDSLILRPFNGLILRPFDNFIINTMALMIGRNTTLFYLFHDYWEESADPRTKGYPLADISGTLMMAFIQFGYIISVTILIPMYMKNRKPYNLNNVIIVYDFSMVIINAYFFFYAVSHVRDMWDFTNPKTDTSEKAIKFINTAYLYYLSKLIDLLDTFFMAFKKKDSHITFLHVWHHFSVSTAGWLFMKYNPYMPTEYLFPLLNGFIHVVMYGYYGLAALGPHMQKYLWWKKYITQLQLVQMTIGMFWFGFVWIRQTDMPFWYLALNFGNAATLFVLFMNFYIQSYKTKVKSQHVKAN